MQKTVNIIPQRFSVAPMIDWTDRHARYFLRLISKKAYLYTEMVTTGAILHGDKDFHVKFNELEKPLALQLGGSDPKALAECARIGEDYGYDEINLNVGCPSERVQNGRFGACLMKEPLLVADCIHAMQARVKIPVTIKTRIGVDDQDSYELLARFIEINKTAGCKIFIMHARKAWLKGLSPKENREIPPLNYEVVHQLQRDFPSLTFILNGGIQNLSQAVSYLETVPGVMLGRAIIQSPYILHEVDSLIYGEKDSSCFSREEILHFYLDYARKERFNGVPFSVLARPLIGLQHGLAGARQWRRELMSFLQITLR